jgi:WD40 repeat protein
MSINNSVEKLFPSNSAYQSSFDEPLDTQRFSGKKRKFGEIKTDADRFIPSRSAIEQSMSFETYSMKSPKTFYENTLVEQVFPFYSQQKTLLSQAPKSFTVSLPPPKESLSVPQKAFKILEAPYVINDFYYNSLDWGTKNLVGINLDKTSYVYNTVTRSTAESIESGNKLTSIKLNPLGGTYARANEASRLDIVDPEKKTPLLGIENVNNQPIYSLDWRNPFELTVGTQNQVFHFDSRSRKHCWRMNQENAQKICSLKWNDGKSRFATGNNFNEVQIFDLSRTQGSLYHYSHQGAVKALKWNPEKSEILLSGGGTGDKMLKVFDSAYGKQIARANVGNQICDVIWLNRDYFVAGLGYLSAKPLEYWKYIHSEQKLKKIEDVALGEANEIGAANEPVRILNLAKDPNSSTFCSLSTNEELCFWKPQIAKIQNKVKSKSILSLPEIR